MNIKEQCEKLAKEHADEAGGIICGIVDYYDLWQILAAESFRVANTTMQVVGLDVLDKPVIQRDEHEGPPQWVPARELLAWSKQVLGG